MYLCVCLDASGSFEADNAILITGVAGNAVMEGANLLVGDEVREVGRNMQAFSPLHGSHVFKTQSRVGINTSITYRQPRNLISINSSTFGLNLIDMELLNDLVVRTVKLSPLKGKALNCGYSC